ncbi:MAG: hypothetical protein COA69_01320 [Robiginitomaculum sp.]|nr:MAG: hypothetical protein COA69_01320 [Robiginitomaculum sp.]
MSADPTPCWVISDGRRGIENQVLGLAEAVSRLHPCDIRTQIIKTSETFTALPPNLQFILKPQPGDYGLPHPLTPPPRLAIGCGRQAIAPLRTLKKTYGPDIFTVYVQAPRINPKRFDLVIVPTHDRVRAKNIVTMTGSPNRITPDRLRTEMKPFLARLKTLPAPRVTVLIGGDSKTHILDKTIHAQHLDAIHTLLGQHMSLLITSSRRTPDWVKADYQALSDSHKRVWFWNGVGENPYFAFLGSANAILVTEDSTNMLTEACATGKPVFTLPMSGKPGKFAKLYTELSQRCHVSPFMGSIDATAYDPLDETARIANIVLERLEHMGTI